MENDPGVPPHILPRFTQPDKYTFEVGAAMIREIRQRSKNGQPNTWGMGCVHMTFMTERKDILGVFNSWDTIVDQLKPKKRRRVSVQQVSTLKKQRKEDTRVERVVKQRLLAPRILAPGVPDIITRYHAHCCEKLQAGNIGLVPRLFGQSETRSFQNLIESDEGKLLLHFCAYARKHVF